MNTNNENLLKNIIITLLDENISECDVEDSSKLIDHFGFDSILIVQLIAEVEACFMITFDDEDLDLDIINNYKNLKNLVQKKITKLERLNED